MPRVKVKWITGAATAVAVMSLASAAGAATLSTGVVGSFGDPEVNWHLTSPDGNLTIVSGPQAYPPGTWITAPGGSNWITPSAGGGTTATDAPVGEYVYTLHFADPGTDIPIRWSSDNGATFSLNGGATLSTVGDNGFSSLVSFVIPALSFALGDNYFTVTVQNISCDCNNPTGLLVSTPEFAAPTATPLPAALPLFATGLGALGVFGWRRKKKAAALAA